MLSVVGWHFSFSFDCLKMKKKDQWSSSSSFYSSPYRLWYIKSMVPLSY